MKHKTLLISFFVFLLLISIFCGFIWGRSVEDIQNARIMRSFYESRVFSGKSSVFYDVDCYMYMYFCVKLNENGRIVVDSSKLDLKDQILLEKEYFSTEVLDEYKQLVRSNSSGKSVQHP